MFVFSPTKQSHAAGEPVRGDDLRAHNAALIMRALWVSEDGAARIDLARDSGLSRATISTIVSELLDTGVVVEGDNRASRGGRPARILRFDDSWRTVLGLELGASHVSGVRTNLRGDIEHSVRVEHDVQIDPKGTLDFIRGVVDELLLDVDVPVLGIGLAVPSPVLDARSGELSADLFPRWRGIDLRQVLEEHVGCPVFIENDANLGALAEHWWGAGRTQESFAYVKVATGVGAGIIINGDIYRGASGIAGEIGHTAIDAHGPLCRCGLHGCLESLVGTQSLLQRARARAQTLPHRPSWADNPKLPMLIHAAESGDDAARKLIADAGHWLGIALANLLNLLNPGSVILGGRLTKAGDLLLEPLRKAVASRALWSSVADTPIQMSALPGEAIAKGAATLVLQAALSNPMSTMLGDASHLSASSWRQRA
jgi:predicted NBD/HSP70 family sugar kinase